MSPASRFYLQQAANCAAAAAAAALDNQRQIQLRSRAVWLGLAEREIEVQTARLTREQATRDERERTRQMETSA